ncbi:MAG TPA: glycerophosphodiester phosphodiesterase family protein [Ktedonobacterales bacterium]|jgi:glycerophosphoryl diester phosphodiesterase|nr:glycerophosphodiester phosphodiesterase family protein [Ktedonobacterales bacterium]
MAETDMAQEGRPSHATRRVLCYAHRGARGHAPENTLLAFDMAFDLGAEAIECDVQRTSDSQLVILHDGTVNRTTDGKGLVAAQTQAKVRSLNAGRRWGLVQQVPTLDETLQLVRRRAGAINLEIKAEGEAEALGTAQSVAPVLQALESPLRERLLVSSFELPAMRLLKQRLPWLRVAALYGGREWKQRDMIAVALEMGAEAIHPGVGLTTAELIRDAHAAGLQVNVWTANSLGTINRLLMWNVDGLFSDFPERVIIARARASASGQAGAKAS